MNHFAALGCGLLGLAMFGGACKPSQGNDLNKMPTARLTIGAHPFDVWVADDDDEREHGLMFVGADKLADTAEGVHRGMLFVFDVERPQSFWMKNTIVPLDIAFIKTDGRIVRQHTMKPLDESSYPSGRPVRFALEVRGNLFSELGIREGDHVTLPDSVLKKGQ